MKDPFLMLNTHIVSSTKFDVKLALSGKTLQVYTDWFYSAERSVVNIDRALIMTYCLLVHSLQRTNHMHLLHHPLWSGV